MPLKSRAPEYPRPVSPVCADEIPTCTDTILYYHHDDGIEEDDGQRKAKRRRIEARATSFLRGQPLFILTAGLKGPFEDGWRNPWTERSKLEDLTPIVPNPTHATIPTNPAVLSSPASTKRRGRLVPAETDKDLAERTNDHSDMDEGLALSSAYRRPPMETSGLGYGHPSRDPKVEYWLRTSEANESSEDAHPDSLPHSPSDGKSKQRTPLRLTANISPVKDVVAVVASDKDVPYSHVLISKPIEHLTKSFSSPVNSRSLRINDEARNIRSSSLRARSPRLPLQKRDRNTQLPCTDETRAEHAISKLRPSVASVSTAAVNKDTAHSHVDNTCGQAGASRLSEKGRSPFPSAHRDVIASVDSHSASNQPSSLHTAQKAAPTAGPEQGSPAYEATKSSMASELPSAQVLQGPILPSLPSNLSSHDQMLQDAVHHSFTAVVENGSIGTPFPPLGPGSRVGEDAHHPSPNSQPTPATKPEAPVKGTTRQDPQENTEGDVIFTRVLGVAAITSKTLKGSVDGTAKTASPQGVGKPTISKSRKRKATANEERSSASIKSALKVAKAGATGEKEVATFSKSTVHYSGDDRQLHENATHGSLPEVDGRVESSLRESAPPRSILKLLPQHSMGASTTSVSSSTNKQDAQRLQELDLQVGDADFDLDGAISDLGSFLDTWDVEKHAAGVL